MRVLSHGKVTTKADSTPLTQEQINEWRKAGVDSERDRRVAAGFAWGGKTFQSDPESMANIAGQATSAAAFIALGGSPDEVFWNTPTEQFVWIAADNSMVPLTPRQMIALGNAAKLHKQRHIFRAREIKSMAEIPDDYTADSLWQAG